MKKNTPEGLGFDVVFEASGDPGALNIAINITRPRGVVHLKSTPGELFKVDMTKAVVKELRIMGTRCGNFRDFKRAIDLTKSNIVKPLITTVFNGIDKGIEALERSIRGEDIKVVVKLSKLNILILFQGVCVKFYVIVFN
jgi:alcohol dehydrogenase